MEATASQKPLNEVQLHLLKVFSFTKNEDDLKELRAVLFGHYRNKLKAQANEFWENNHLNSAQMEEIMYGHNRIAEK
jgi:hypothetical protein